jgi:hypothetical protein
MRVSIESQTRTLRETGSGWRFEVAVLFLSWGPTNLNHCKCYARAELREAENVGVVAPRKSGCVPFDDCLLTLSALMGVDHDGGGKDFPITCRNTTEAVNILQRCHKSVTWSHRMTTVRANWYLSYSGHRSAHFTVYRLEHQNVSSTCQWLKKKDNLDRLPVY